MNDEDLWALTMCNHIIDYHNKLKGGVVCWHTYYFTDAMGKEVINECSVGKSQEYIDRARDILFMLFRDRTSYSDISKQKHIGYQTIVNIVNQFKGMAYHYIRKKNSIFL